MTKNPIFGISRIQRAESGELYITVETFTTGSIMDEPVVAVFEATWDSEWGINDVAPILFKDTRRDVLHLAAGWLARSAKAQDVVQEWLLVEETENVVERD